MATKKRIPTSGRVQTAADYAARGYAPILGVRLMVEERAELERIAREWGTTPTGALRRLVAHAAKGLYVEAHKPEQTTKPRKKR